MTKKIQLRKVQLAVLLCLAVFSYSFTASAETYTITSSGKFSDPEIWSPSFPGKFVKEGDQVVVTKNVQLDDDLIVKGSVKVEKHASLTGSGNVIIMNTGVLENYGIMVASGYNNLGIIENHNILEASMNMINRGEVNNHQSLTVGNILENTGVITGNHGLIMVTKKAINTNTGQIVGNIDICSDNFMNINGAQIDSINLSFCGNRIFSGLYLTADLYNDGVIINLENGQYHLFESYELEKSPDGVNFQTVAQLDKGQINDPLIDLEFRDKEIISSDKIYYRLKFVDEQGVANYVPTLEVNNIYAGR